MKTMVLILALFVSLAAHAQWSSDSTVNIALSDTASTMSGNALAPRAVFDGNGGAFIVWGNVGPIRGQLVNVNGNIQWDRWGNTVGSSRQPDFIASLLNPVSISDDSGGAIIAWIESSQRTIGASRVRTDGTIAWDKLICYTTGVRTNPALTPDGAGGAYIVWQDTRNGSANIDIFAQRVSRNGVALWDSNGVAVCTAVLNQTIPSIAYDSVGGAFITWQDNRTPDADIYAQRINSLGQGQWQVNGMVICASGNPAGGPKIVATARGEAIIAWTNGNSGGTWDIYGQKANLDTVQWAANGVPICNAPLSQTSPAIVPDGFGGAIVTWEDTRISFSDPNVYAQRMSSGGLGRWTLNGIPICTSPDRQVASTIIPDGDGGAIIAWEDYRSGTYYDIYAQRVNSGGSTLWTNNGRVVCVAPRDQRFIGITSDGRSGAIITWADYRNNVRFVIYAQRVRADGLLGGTTAVDDHRSPPMEFSLDQNYPNPFNPSTRIRFQISVEDPTRREVSHVSLKVFDVLGREVQTLVNEQMQPGSYSVQFDGRNLSSGVYFYRLTSGGQSLTKKLLLTK